MSQIIQGSVPDLQKVSQLRAMQEAQAQQEAKQIYLGLYMNCLQAVIIRGDTDAVQAAANADAFATAAAARIGIHRNSE